VGYGEDAPELVEGERLFEDEINVQLSQMVVKVVVLVGSQERNNRFMNLFVSFLVTLSHVVLNRLYSVDSIKPRHHEVSQKMAHFVALGREF
jgi:hypothetical protein